jgi:hypothetical protein
MAPNVILVEEADDRLRRGFGLWSSPDASIPFGPPAHLANSALE